MSTLYGGGAEIPSDRFNRLARSVFGNTRCESIHCGIEGWRYCYGGGKTYKSNGRMYVYGKAPVPTPIQENRVLSEAANWKLRCLCALKGTHKEHHDNTIQTQYYYSFCRSK